MAVVKPFKAWRPTPSFVKDIACLPYDVVDTKKAKLILKDQENSFIKVIRPEADFAHEISIYDELVYAKGRQNLLDFFSSHVFEKENDFAIYIYQLTWQNKIINGIFGCVAVQDYDDGVILKHELTRPEKENDRTKHILHQKAHSEPVMLTYEANPTINQFIQTEKLNIPLYQFIADDNTEHCIWKTTNFERVISAFEAINHLYIADGHHRCASASRVAKTVDINKHADALYFPAVLFPMDELKILAYNRIILSVEDNFIDILGKNFSVQENAPTKPTKPGNISLYYESKWYGITLPQSKFKSIDAQLDVSRLQEFILDPILDIKNQRTNKNISFIGGISSIEENPFRKEPLKL